MRRVVSVSAASWARLLLAALFFVAVALSTFGSTPLAIRAQDPTATSEATITVTPDSNATPTPIGFNPVICENAPALQLKPGQQAKVVALNDPVLPGAMLKPQPDPEAPVIRYLPLDTPITVLHGPECDVSDSQWWFVQVGNLQGWLTETQGQTYILEPAEDDVESPTTLDSTTMLPLNCFQPSDPAAPPDPGIPLLRVVYANEEGKVFVSDLGAAGREVAQFNPMPTSVDLSPDGTAIAVTNENGIYWIDAETGNVVMLADGPTFELPLNAWTNRALWLPNGRGLAVEVEDRNGGINSFGIYSFPTDGTSQFFRVDAGAQPANSLRLSPPGNRLVVLSANDISTFPTNIDDDKNLLLEYTPVNEEEDALRIFSPAISWSVDGAGFYTYIPAGVLTAPDDPVANRLWYVPLDGTPAKDLGVPPGIAVGEYVIPSPDGKNLLLGRGFNWRIQSVDSGEVVRTVPPIEYVFDWTPDGKGVIYTTPDSFSAYIGIDGSTETPYLSSRVQGLYNVRWLPDGTALYLARTDTSETSFALGIQIPSKAAVTLDTVAGSNSYGAAVLPGIPGTARTPQKCSQ
ncbi:MAG: hypothetical protein U0528_16810 [Anaerolineae bacterium]